MLEVTGHEKAEQIKQEILQQLQFSPRFNFNDVLSLHRPAMYLLKLAVDQVIENMGLDVGWSWSASETTVNIEIVELTF